MGSTAATVAGAATAAALGSIASQLVGNALGIVDGFSWKAVALAAIAGGVGGGVDAAFGLGDTVLRAVIKNAVTQGIGVATGLQDSFDWRGVAAAGIGAGVGYGVGGMLGNSLGTDTLGQVAKSTITGFAAGIASAAARGGRVNITQVATDAFGNALGESLKDSIVAGSRPAMQGAGPYSAADYRNGMDIESDNYAGGNRFSAASAAYGVAGSVQATNGYARSDDYSAGAPRSGMIFTDGGWIDPNGLGGYGGGDSMLLADASGSRLRLSRGSTLDDLDQQIKDERGVLNALDNKAARQQAARAAYDKEAAQATSDLYKSGAGDVRGPFYSPAPSGGYGGASPEFDIPQTITEPSVSSAPGIPGTGTGTAANPYILPPVVVTAPRMTQAEMDAFDQQNSWSYNAGGQSALGLWDTQQRTNYHRVNVAASQTARVKIDLARMQNNPGAATEAARLASQQRIDNRALTRQSLSTGGYKLSLAVDQSQPPEYYFKKYGTPGADAFATAEKVSKGVASSNKYVDGLGNVSKVLAPLGVGYGAYSSTTNIMNAPAGERGYVVAKETGTWVGGWYGASWGMAGGVAAAVVLGATPVGWGILAGGIIGGAVGGLAGSNVGAWGFGTAYKSVTTSFK